MNRIVLTIEENQIEVVKSLFEKYNINYYQPGYPNGKVEVKESYPSKINLHVDMTKYAKQKGYKSLTEAINRMGSRTFKMKFNKEFNTIDNG